MALAFHAPSMADALKTTSSGNLFVVFGEADIEIEPTGDGQIRVKIKGVDVFHPQTGEVESRLKPAERVAAVDRQVHFVALGGEQPTDSVPHSGVIIDNENVQWPG